MKQQCMELLQDKAHLTKLRMEWAIFTMTVPGTFLLIQEFNKNPQIWLQELVDVLIR
jgi:hypothetical protein